MSSINPITNQFRDFHPGPHSGVDDDLGDYVDPGAMDSRARTALTLGLLSLVVGFLAGVPAIWLGRRALGHIAAANGGLRGRWAAWAGIALGTVGVVGSVVVWVYPARPLTASSTLG